ncbi:hypothetical protein Q1695_008922 [Nippostrongylus brasiliensis]|nr:hypothetical protein Q1695_008922 [Nippostrongylus brasiliensis]
MSLGASRLVQAACGQQLAIRNMYNNPYVARFKQRSKVSPDFYKKTTGLTGLFVNERPHRTLKVVYSRILKALEQIPPTLLTGTLKEKIGMGQIEEVIEQAEYELEVARAILESKAWEALVEEAPKGQWNWPIV